MEICPVTDSASSILSEPQKCSTCGSTLRLQDALCLNCLLHFALQDDAAASSKATFKDALAAIDPQATDWRIGDYEILDEIGRGGMGIIYRAREPHSRRIVALKCVLGYQIDSDQTLARFRREAETAARLDHPNIIPIYHVGESPAGVPFFTMKLASGGSLLQARATLRREPRQCVLLMTKVALAVQYAHEQGVLHRDLKPGNILLDHRWEPLVSDFGLAKWQETSSNLTRSLTIFGTPGYIAPEQAEAPATHLTAAADVYSLGAILFELLTGRPPFLGEHALAVIRQALEKVAPRLRSLAPRLDRDLETMCARCLERDSRARYHSCRELAQDLRSWLDNRPIKARSAGIAVRVSRWFCRNRMFGGTLAVSGVLAIASLFWLVYGWRLQSAMREMTFASRSVVVLPFLDLDNVAPDPVLAHSLAGSLQNQLNAFGPTLVKTRESEYPLSSSKAEDVRRAGQESKTRTVLTGTERTVQGKKRISVRLADSATGEPLFRDLGEENAQTDTTRAVTARIARKIYTILSAKDWSHIIQSQADPALRNNVAREDILAGRELMSLPTASSNDHAIALFRKAVRAAPDSSLAHSYLAMAATGRTHYIADSSFLELGKEESHNALRLSPASSDAHRALAAVCYQEGKFREALEEGMRAIEMGGLEQKVVCFLGMTLDTLGKPDQALTWYSLGLKLGGGAPGEMDALIGDCWVKLCDDERALQAYNAAMELQPESPQGGVGICHLRLLQGDFQGAREFWQTGRWIRNDLGETDNIAAQIEFFGRNFQTSEKLYENLVKTDPEGGGSFHGAVTYQSALGRTRQALGDKTGGRILLERCLVSERAAIEREPTNPETLYRLAAIESALGILEPSIHHLRVATSLGWIDYRSLTLDPRFDLLRKEPELQIILNDLSAKIAGMRLKSQNTNRKKRNDE